MEGKDAVEFERCAKDFFHFAETYIKVHHPKNGLVNYKPQEFHKRLFSLYEENRFVISKKFRQGWFTTFNAIYALWKCMFELDKSILFLAKTDREALAIQWIVKNAIKNLPEWLSPKLKIDNQHEKVFEETGCKLWFYAPVAARSRSVQYLFIEEAAFINDMNEHWKAIWPVLSTGGKCFVNSTTNGTNNWFYEKWIGAVQKKNNFVPFHAHYTEHRDFQSADFTNTVKSNLGEKRFKQEFECLFYDLKNKKFIENEEKEMKVMEYICDNPEKDALDDCFDFNVRTKEQLEKLNSYVNYKTEEKSLTSRWDKFGLLQELTDHKKGSTAVLLENQRLYNEMMTDTGDIAQFKRISIPLVRRICGSMKSFDLVAVEAMVRPVQIVYMGQEGSLKEIDAVANTKKYKTVWCYELGHDLRSQHNLDHEKELTAIIAENISMENDRMVLTDLRNGAALKKTIDFNNLLGSPDCKMKVAKHQLTNMVRELHDLYGKPTCNWIVISPELKSVLNIVENGTGLFSSSLGIDELGTWKMDDENELKVYVDPLFPPGQALVGYKGQGHNESGYVLSTYVPLMQTPVVLDPETYMPRKGLLTRQFAKLVDPTYYACFTLTNFQDEKDKKKK